MFFIFGRKSKRANTTNHQLVRGEFFFLLFQVRIAVCKLDEIFLVGVKNLLQKLEKNFNNLSQ